MKIPLISGIAEQNPQSKYYRGYCNTKCRKLAMEFQKFSKKSFKTCKIAGI
jgi:hypothetical protein